MGVWWRVRWLSPKIISGMGMPRRDWRRSMGVDLRMGALSVVMVKGGWVKVRGGGWTGEGGRGMLEGGGRKLVDGKVVGVVEG